MFGAVFTSWGHNIVASDVVRAPEIQVVEAIVALMLVATVVGLVAHRVKLPYTISLVLVGIGLSWLQLIPHIHLTQDLLMFVFLPALLFEAAIHFPANELRKYAPTIATLAAPGVLLTAVATAFVLQWEHKAFGITSSMGFADLLLFGTLIAATDPISVITLFRQLGVSRKLSLIIEGESLFNDGTAIVLFLVVLETIQYGNFQFTDAIVKLGVVAVGGILTGIVFGLLAGLIISFTEDHLIAIAVTTVTAYGSYLVAEKMAVSGVLATVIAGLFVGNIGQKKGLTPSNRIAVVSFWEYLAFFVGSLVFLLIGLEVNIGFLLRNAELVMLAFAAVLASRAISVFLPLPILRRFGQPMSIKNATAVWWGGMRGSLSMVLVLSLPVDMPARESLIAMTFGVVVLSVVVQGSTMGVLLRWLKLVTSKTEAMVFLSSHLARLKANYAQQEAVSRLATRDIPALGKLAVRLEDERDEILRSLESRKDDPEFQKANSVRMAGVEDYLNQVARDSYRESLKSNLVDENEVAALISVIDDKSNLS